MDLSKRIEKNICIVYIQTDHFLNSSTEFMNYVKPLMSTSSFEGLLLNFEGVAFMNSYGFGVVLEVFKTITAKGLKFGLCSITNPVLKVLQITKTQDLFNTYATEAEALENMPSTT